MKRVLQRFLALMMVLWTSSQLSAQDFLYEGIYYRIDSEAERTCKVIRDKRYLDYKIEDVVIPSSVIYENENYTVTGIDESAFNMWRGTSISFPETLKSIGDNVFALCPNLTSLTIPASVTSISGSWIGNCPRLDKVVMLGATPPQDFKPYVKNYVVFVPEGSLQSYKESEGWKGMYLVEGDGSGNYLFGFEKDGIYYNVRPLGGEFAQVAPSKGDAYTGKITIPENVTYNGKTFTVNEIENFSFSRKNSNNFSVCEIDEIIIPASIKSIGSSAFGSLTKPLKVVMKNPVPLENSFYLQNPYYAVIYVPEGSLEAYEQSWEWRKYLLVEGNGDKTYITCFEVDGFIYQVIDPVNGGTDVRIASASNSIKYLKDVVIPSTVEHEGLAFNVTEIGEGALERATMESISIPSTISKIGTNAFYSCMQLVEVNFPESNIQIEGDAFSYCTSLEEIDIPEGVSVGWDMFNGCRSLKHVTIHGTFVSQNAFSNCPSLESFTSTSENVPSALNPGFSDENYSQCILYVPDDAIAEYQDQSPWKNFTTIKGLNSKPTVTISERTLALKEGTTAELTATVTPESIEDKSVTWSTQDPDIATVDANGKVTALSVGTTKITATSPLGASASCIVTVTAKRRVELEKTELLLAVGSSETLKTKITPALTGEEKVTWTSSDATVASVNESGTVTALTPGETIITVTCEEGSAECAVTVTEKVVPAESIEIIASEEPVSAKTLKKGETLQLTAKTTPVDATDKITWSIGESESITIVPSEDGRSCEVTAVKVGEATVTVKAGEKSASCEITVISPAESITLEVEGETITDETINKGDKLNITATIVPEDCTDAVEWSVEGDAVTIAVSEDKMSCEVTAVKAGEATVTVKAGEKLASCKITVEVPMTGIELDKNEAEGYIGGTIQLTATVKPEDTTDDTTVTWESSDENVATVDENGLVSCLAEGTAVITATCGEFSDECTVTVTDRPPFVGITSLELSATEVELPLNYTYSLFGIIAPENATNTELEWSTSNPEVARVYQGVVYGIVPGEAVITAKTTDGSNLSASCKFTIVATSGIEGTEGDAVKVSGKAGIITVKGAAAGATVEVYSMSGACVAVKTVESSVEELPVAASGIYVVRVNGKTFKVAL